MRGASFTKGAAAYDQTRCGFDGGLVAVSPMVHDHECAMSYLYEAENAS